MKFSHNWLKEYVDIDLPPQRLAKELTMLGLEVEDFSPLNGNDTLFELELTPNYAAHCQSLVGIAREVAALTEQPLQLPPVTQAGEGAGESPFSVAINDDKGCPRYSGRYLWGITVKQSPAWLRERLASVGVRPISNVVDVTNYVMLEFGQPLHAFDAALLQGKSIRVRRAGEGEELRTLDGVQRELNTEDLVIADERGAVALAGVMGGAFSEVSPTTEDVFLESANFDPVGVRHMSRRLGLRTESSMRFEKGVDPNGTVNALNRVVHLLAEMDAVEKASAVVDVYPEPVEAERIGVRAGPINRRLGTSLTAEQIAGFFQRFDFTVEDVDGEKETDFEVVVPARRPDVTTETDLIEEVARLYGYNRIETTLPKGAAAAEPPRARDRLLEKAADVLVGAGFQEVVNTSFLSPQFLSELNLAEEGNDDRVVRVSNPMTEDQGALRTTLIPGILATLRENLRHQNRDFAVFEIGRVYFAREVPLERLPEEVLRIGGGAVGRVAPPHWSDKDGRTFDFFDLKGVFSVLLDRLNIRSWRFEAAGGPFWHPGRCARLYCWQENEPAGVFGQIHPDVSARLELEAPVYVFELRFDVLLRAEKESVSYQPLPDVPPVSRDLAMILDRSVAAAAVEEKILEAGGEWLESVTLFDLYEGDPVPDGKRSLAFSLVYRDPDRTLTDQEVDAQHERVREALRRSFEVELRS